MLTENQKQFIAKIPVDATSNIKPWDKAAAEYAKTLAQEIESLGLEAFWEGSLALGIPGENDIDLYVFSEPEDFGNTLPKLAHILGDPTYILPEKILWRIRKDGHKIDASLASKDSPEVKMDMLFFSSLESDPALLKEYSDLKTPGLPAKEYYTRKNEFYNRITGNK